MIPKGQYLATLAVSLGGFSAGTMLGWTSPAFEHLKPTEANTTSSNTTLFEVSLSQESAICAMLSVGALAFGIPSGKLADKLGRKPVLQLLSILYTLAWVISALAWDAATLIVARFVGGLAVGGACAVCPMYIGEIADNRNRGILGSFFSNFLGLGVLYTSIIGSFTGWLGLNVGLGIFSVLFGLTLICIPETPVFLIGMDKLEEAKKSLMFLKGDVAVASEELTSLQRNQPETQNSVTLAEFFKEKSYRSSLIAGLGIFILQQTCGINPVVFYSVPIFREAGISLPPSSISIMINSIALATGIGVVFLIEKKGRKYFLLLSAWSMFLGAVGLGLFFHLKSEQVNITGIFQTIPVLSAVLILSGFALGFGPIPWVLISELYSVEVRGIASGVNTSVNWTTCVLITSTFPILLKYIGNYLTFYMYGVFNFASVLFIWFLVPETKTGLRK
ncbi:facilitated trehalose transporter Tret1-like [Sitophilus oryzae]|uniref:Facilitated trehalose transporter Tret1-like n=1 Tax=Sitophilus oryzae TaxID=7048 RepID=A0A6J2YFN6_SITOR|nr:facilitated trehalose transporter Tret1-like [Sitophilus oryzae]